MIVRRLSSKQRMCSISTALWISELPVEIVQTGAESFSTNFHKKKGRDMNKRQREKRAKEDRRKEEYQVLVKALRNIGKVACDVSRAITKAFHDQMAKARIRREAKEAKRGTLPKVSNIPPMPSVKPPKTTPDAEMASYQEARRTASQYGMPFVEDDPKRGFHPMFTDPPQGPTVPELPKDAF